MKGNKEVLTDFFNGIFYFIASNSSKDYGLVTLRNLKKTLASDFPFIVLIKLNGRIKVDRRIDSIGPTQIGGLINRIIDVLGPDILRMFIREKLDKEDLKYLSQVGVNF